MSRDVELGVARRRFVGACAVGGVVAAVGFTWMLVLGRLDLFQSHVLDGLYDAQAHRLLGGHWDVPARQLSIEAFLIHGKAYMYFGPWPALLRLPIAAFTHSLDGRLTQLSMLGAFAVLMVATTRLLWRVRVLARGSTPVTRRECLAVGIFVLVVGAGSVVMFLGSRPLVYHEASLWGAALAVGAYGATLDFVLRPGRRALVWAGVLAGLSLLSRSSVGIGPVVALGLVLAGRLLVALARRFRRPQLYPVVRWLGLGDESSEVDYVVPLAVAIAVPVAVYMYVNYAKFGSLVSVPITKHITTLTDPVRRSVYAHNGGSLFGVKFVPTNLVAMFRPDALRLDGLFPWITFPGRARTVGGITFAAIDPSSSIPASMPFLVVLGVVGMVAVFRRRRRRRETRGLSAMRVSVLGGVVGGIGALTIPFINQRYTADFLPVIVVLAAVGLHVLLRRSDAPRAGGRGVQRLVVVVLALLAAASLWVNFGLAILYQREYSPFPAESERAAFVRFQFDLDQHLPGGSRLHVRSGPRLPDPLPVGTVFVVGHCDGVYWSDGTAWHPVELTHATGRFPLRVTFPDRPPGTRETLLTAGPPDAQDRVEVEYQPGHRVRFRFKSTRLPQAFVGSSQSISPGRPTRVDIDYDAPLGQLEVDLDGRNALAVTYLLTPAPIGVVGGGVPAAGLDFGGRARLEPTPHRFCSRIAPESARSRAAR